MEENYFAAARNGHEMKDMYNPETNTLDIRSNGMYPSNVLSNLCSNGFRFDGVVCNSMEGFLQSLKQQDLEKQRQICSMKGGNARKKSVTSWQTDQIVWWKGQTINRQSEEYQMLIRQAYQAMFEQNERFRVALMSSRGTTLTHTTGEDNPYKTILTPKELCSILMEMRDEYDRQISEQANEPMVRELGYGTEDGARGPIYAIHPALLIDRKLVIRSNAGAGPISLISNNLPNHLEGLKLDAAYEIEDDKLEIKLSPLQSENHLNDYVIHTDFGGGCSIAFFTEDTEGNRQIIGRYEY